MSNNQKDALDLRIDNLLKNNATNHQSDDPIENRINGLLGSPKKDKGIGGHVQDTAVSLLGGTVGAVDAVVGLADIPTGGRVGKFLENKDGMLGLRTKEASDIINSWHTDQYKQQQKDFSSQQGIVDKAKFALQNPSLLTNSVVESAPSMVLGGTIGRGLGLATKAAPVLAGAIGEGLVSGGQAAEQMRHENTDGLLTSKNIGAALGTVGTTAGLSLVGGKLANKLGVDDFETAMARQGASATQKPLGLKNYAKAIGGGALSEGGFEELPQSVTEQMWQNYGQDKPLMEGTADAAVMGLLTGGLMGGGINAARGVAFKSNDTDATDQTPSDNATPYAQSGTAEIIDPNTPQLEYAPPQPPQALPFTPPRDQFNVSPDGVVFGDENINEYLQGKEAQDEAMRKAGMPTDINDITPVPNDATGFNVDIPNALPAPTNDFTVDANGNVINNDALNAQLEAQRQADIERRNRIASGLPTDATAIPQDATGFGVHESDTLALPYKNDIMVDSQGNAYAGDQINEPLQSERQQNIENLARRLQGKGVNDVTPVPSDTQGFGIDFRTPAEKLGLDANQGGLSSAAAVAVDTGASPIAAELQQQVPQDQGDTQSSNGQAIQATPQAPLTALAQDIAPAGQANAAPTIEPILGKDGKNKWFATQNKADEFIQKKSLGDNYTIEQTGKMRYEIVPKVQEQTPIQEPQRTQQERRQMVIDAYNTDNNPPVDAGNYAQQKAKVTIDRVKQQSPSLYEEAKQLAENAEVATNKNNGRTAHYLTFANDDTYQADPFLGKKPSKDEIMVEALMHVTRDNAPMPPKNREGLLLDYQTHSDAIDKDIESRGLTEQLHSIAGATTERPFSEMSKEKQAKAYADLVESGAKPANIMETSDEQAARLEQSAEMRRLQSTDTITQKNGKPFKQQQAAEKIIQENNLRFTHEVKQVDDGFILKQLSPAAQQEAKNKADGIESYTDIQSRVAKDMGVGTNEYGEYDVSDEQFAEMNKRVDAIQREQRGLKPIQDSSNTTASQPKLYGKESYIQTGSERQPTRVAVVEADNLAPDDKNTENQFRDRTRMASQMQIDNIANNLDPRQLSDTSTMATGSPTLANDGKTIIAGNGRTKAIKQAYAQGKGAEYKQSLIEQAASLGIDPQQIAGMKNPVLVKEFVNPVDVKKMAIESNATGGLAMSAKEQARADSEMLPDVSMLESDDKGGINLSRNAPIFRKFISAMPVESQASMLDKDGLLSKEGLHRLQNAILYKAYGDSKAFDDMVENTSPALQNVINGMVRTAPKIAQAKENIASGTRYDSDISDDISSSLGMLQQLRKNQMSVSDYLAQIGLFDDNLSPVAKELVQYLYENINKPKAISDLFSTYYDMLDSLGNPNQQDLLGDKPNTDKQSLFQQALERVRNARQPKQATNDLFAEPTADSAGQSANQADNAVEQRPNQSQGDGAGVGAGENEVVGGISDFIEQSISNPSIKNELSLGGVNEVVAKKLKENGYDIVKYPHTLTSENVRHIINRHGNESVEKQRGQLPMTSTEIQQIPTVLNSPDYIVLGGKTRRGLQTIIYVKRLDNGTVMTVEEVRTGRKQLAITTAMKYATGVNANPKTNPNLYVQNGAVASDLIVIDFNKTVNKPTNVKDGIAKTRAKKQGKKKSDENIAETINATINELDIKPNSRDSRSIIHSAIDKILGKKVGVKVKAELSDILNINRMNELNPISAENLSDLSDKELKDNRDRLFLRANALGKIIGDIKGKPIEQYVTANINNNLDLYQDQLSKYDKEIARRKDGAFDPNNNDIRYSQMGEYTPDLIVTHNLTADAIIHADKIGGLPFASIAITKQDNPLTGFGEVTLIGDKNLIDPKGVNKAKVFGSDIYSPRYPRVVVKADNKKLAQFNKDLEPARQVIESSQQISEEDFAGKYNVLNDSLVKLHFLQQNGINIERKYREVEEEVSGNKDQIDSAKADVKSLEQFAGAFGVESVEQYLAQATDSEIYTKVQEIDENNPDAIDAIFKTLTDAKVERSPFKTRVRMIVDNIRMSRGKIGNYLIGNLQSMAGVVSGRTQLVENGVRKKQVFDYSDTINQIDKALADNNLEQAFNDYIDNVRSDLVVDERLDNGVTSTGARRTVAHTIENVVKKLKKDLRGGESFNYGLPSVRAKVTPQFKTIQQIQESKDKIITSEQFDLIKKEIDDEMSDLSDKLGLESYLDIGDFLADVIDNGADKAFDFFNVKNSVPNKKLVADFLAKLKDMPTTYFEVKAKEVTQFSDFTGAVVPNSISHKARNILEQAGLKLYTYGSNVGVERADAIKQATTELNNTNGNILFSQTNDTESKLRSELQSLMAMQKQASQGLSLTERANSKQLREIIRRIDETKSELQKVLDKKSQPMQPNSGKENLIVSEYTGSRTVYHGTKAAVADEIMQNGIKFGTQLNDGDYRGGAYGVIQNSTSASLDPNVSKNFSNDAKPSIVKIQLADDAKIITVENEMYAEDLEDYADELKGVDAVYLANNGEQEVVILNKDKVKVVESRGFSIRDAIPRFSVLNRGQAKNQSQALNNQASRTKSNQAAVQNITKTLSDKFGKAAIDKLIADGNLEIIDYAEAKRRNPKTPSKADGYYADGKAVLIADNLSPDMIVPTFLHELGGHGGLQTLMNDGAYQSLLKEFDRMVAEGNPLANEAKAFADATSPNAKVAQDEYLPYLISLAAKAQGNSKVKSMLNRIVMAVKSFIRDKFGVSLKVTPADIVALAEKMVSERAMQSNVTASMSAQYSKQTPQTEIDQVRKQYEGTSQWMKAPNGKLTNLTEQQWLQVRTPSFKAWFGDWESTPKSASKAIDKNGEPLALYHGTNNEFTSFDKNRNSENSGDDGYYGIGFYFTSDFKFAQDFGEKVASFFLNIKNPVYNNPDSLEPILDKFGISKELISVDKNWLLKELEKADINSLIYAKSTMKNAWNAWKSYMESGGDPNGIKLDSGVIDRIFRENSKPQQSDFDYIENNISPIPDNKKVYKYKKSTDIRKLTNLGDDAKEFTEYAVQSGFDGVFAHPKDEYVAFNPNQIKSATDNIGTFNPENDDIRYSQMGGSQAQQNKLTKALTEFLKNPLSFAKTVADNKYTDNLGKALALLGRRQIVDIYKKDLPPLKEYSDTVEQMDADANERAYEADKLVKEWGKLKDELPLAELMHDATLKGIDPAEAYQAGDDRALYNQLRRRYDALSPDAKRIYKQARDDYKAQQRSVFEAIKGRIQRTTMSAPRKSELIKKMEQGFFFGQKVYFPLARFGNYVVAVKDAAGNIVSVSRAETKAQADQLRKDLISQYPNDKVGRVMLDKEFVSSRDGVTRGFMSDLFDAVDELGLTGQQKAEFEDTLGQLYLNSLPDISFAKSGMHRKGIAGFSQNARRAYAQHMSRGSHYVAKMRHADVLQSLLDDMQDYVKTTGEQDANYDQPKMQRVVDEMEKRHESLMNSHNAGWSSLATSIGFMWYMGLSPASALVNLSQTVLVAYPVMGAKWGFAKAGVELSRASEQAAKALNNLQSSLSGDEKTAFDEAVKRGVIDMTQAHDLAGVARGEDDSVMWKIRKPMEWASFMFHHAEKFNRQVTFIASYRLAKQAGANHKDAIEQAIDATYEGHFSYASSNRPRMMQGDWARVFLLFKQYGQNMVYTLTRNAYLSTKGDKQAMKTLAGMLALHGTFAGVLGLPLATTLLGFASALGGDDDEPWDAEIALRNYLAELFGDDASEVISKGLPRALGIDLSSRVGLDSLILPRMQEGLEGQRAGESFTAAMTGPVAGIGVNALAGFSDIQKAVTPNEYLIGTEKLLPKAFRDLIKTYRLAAYGNVDKTGIEIVPQENISLSDVGQQALGFRSRKIAQAQEGKSAIYKMDKEIGGKRQRLMNRYAKAYMAGDAAGAEEAWQDIKRFNAGISKDYPKLKITKPKLMQSIKQRRRRIEDAEDGIYLPNSREASRQYGAFATE